MREQHVNYAPTRFPEKNELKSLLTPGQHVSWQLLNLYLRILTLEQNNSIYHMPCDLICPNGLSEELKLEDVVDWCFGTSTGYPIHWVCCLFDCTLN